MALTGSETTTAMEGDTAEASTGHGAPLPVGSIGDSCLRFPNHPACRLVGMGDHGGNDHNNNDRGGGRRHGPLS